jgi:hypothetical protein
MGKLERATVEQLAGCFQITLGNYDLAPAPTRSQEAGHPSGLRSAIAALDPGGSQHPTDHVRLTLARNGREMHANVHGSEPTMRGRVDRVKQAQKRQALPAAA